MIGQFFAAYDLRLYCKTHCALCAILLILIYWSHHAKFML